MRRLSKPVFFFLVITLTSILALLLELNGGLTSHTSLVDRPVPPTVEIH